ncbi:MAG: methionyl-tRNA formyltransferase [Deltaproteobacteria bacterium]|nr:methionyl-tRNA formyltransferase [Deltaproteobacteria bacterium]
MSDKTQQTYVVAGRQRWNRRVFDETIRHYPGEWHFVGTPEEMTVERMQRLRPRYIFFLHWSNIVSQELLEAFESVCFHMTDLPFGRGGSPLQNLIMRGHRRTQITALRMTSELDAGPVYFKETLCLAESAEEIYIRATQISAGMIERIIRDNPQPTLQSGAVVAFKRRKPSDSEIPETASLYELYDFVRMLDADGYPRAFLSHGGCRYEFGRAALKDGRVIADVTITREKEQA